MMPELKNLTQALHKARANSKNARAHGFVTRKDTPSFGAGSRRPLSFGLAPRHLRAT